jgi:hypothetical protein
MNPAWSGMWLKNWHRRTGGDRRGAVHCDACVPLYLSVDCACHAFSRCRFYSLRSCATVSGRPVGRPARRLGGALPTGDRLTRRARDRPPRPFGGRESGMTVRLGCTVCGLETQPGPVRASASCHFDRRVSISFGAESSSGCSARGRSSPRVCRDAHQLRRGLVPAGFGLGRTRLPAASRLSPCSSACRRSQGLQCRS